MEIIKKPIHNPSIYFETTLKESIVEPYCFLDIETTGFNRQYDQVILIGILYFEQGNYGFHQYFIGQDSNDEALLREFSKDFSRFSTLITYNGLSFDLPFLRDRMRHYRISFPYIHLSHIDLYRHIVQHKNILQLDNYRLSSIEKFLGIDRIDKIDGKESIEKFHLYRRSLDEASKKEILLHNYEDLLHLPMITEIFSHIPSPDYIFHTYHDQIVIGEKQFHYEFESKKLRFSSFDFQLKGKSWSYENYHEIQVNDDLYQFSYDSITGEFVLKLFLFHTVIDGKFDLYYLKLKELNIGLDGKDSDIVDNNFIMVINNRIQYEKAFPVMGKFLNNFFFTYLRKK